jgi:hypothetical protein
MLYSCLVSYCCLATGLHTPSYGSSTYGHFELLPVPEVAALASALRVFSGMKLVPIILTDLSQILTYNKIQFYHLHNVTRDEEMGLYTGYLH